MATLRISKSIRDSLESLLIQQTFGDRKKILVTKEDVLGDKIYRDTYPTKTREAMAKLPEGFLIETNTLRVVLGGSHTFVNFGEMRRIATKHKSYSAAKVYPVNHHYAQEYAALVEEKSKLENEVHSAKADIRAVISQARTVPQLLRIWPEVEPVLNQVLGKNPGKTNLPSVPIKELNKKLGLEKKK